jgi:hypothetical protein
MGRWISESGLTVEEAANELARRVNAGGAMPWNERRLSANKVRTGSTPLDPNPTPHEILETAS